MNSYLSRLTFLRFLAAVAVVYFHVGQKVPPATYGMFRTVIPNGHLAVSFFFCLSGFVLTTVYGHEKFSAVSFWIARFSRIYPVYLLCLLCGCLLLTFPVTALVLDVLLLQSWIPGYPSFINPPAWSLSVEALFYALFPLMMGFYLKVSFKTVVILTIALWIGTQFLAGYFFTYHFHGFQTPSSDAIFYFPLMHLNEFVMGMLGAVVFKKFHERKYAMALSLLAVGASLVIVHLTRSAGQSFGLTMIAEDGLYAPIFVAVLWFFASLPKVLGDVLSWRPLIVLGESSYTLYLLQVPLAYWLPAHLQGLSTTRPVLYFYLYLGILIAVSLAIFLFFERPLRTSIKVFLGRFVGTVASPGRELAT